MAQDDEAGGSRIEGEHGSGISSNGWRASRTDGELKQQWPQEERAREAERGDGKKPRPTGSTTYKTRASGASNEQCLRKSVTVNQGTVGRALRGSHSHGIYI